MMLPLHMEFGAFNLPRLPLETTDTYRLMTSPILYSTRELAIACIVVIVSGLAALAIRHEGAPKNTALR
jgi:hypothetical protein